MTLQYRNPMNGNVVNYCVLAVYNTYVVIQYECGSVFCISKFQLLNDDNYFNLVEE